MVEEVVSCYPTHVESHSPLYEGYHGNDDFPLFSVCHYLLQGIVSQGNSLRYVVWYLSLKASILAGESTKCLNLTIWTNIRETIEIGKWRSKNWKAEEIGRGEKEKIKETETYKN